MTLRVRGPASSSGANGIVIGVHFSPSARLRVAVPKSTALDLRSGDGSITVEEITGAATLRTDDGSIVAARLAGRGAWRAPTTDRSASARSPARSTSRPATAASWWAGR